MSVIFLAMLVAILLLVLFVVLALVRSKGAAHTMMAGVPDWDALADEELQSYLPHQKISAIKRYRDLTGVGLKEAKDTIEYIIANPDASEKAKAGKRRDSSRLIDTEGAGVRDLIASGAIEEAVRVYADFMGVDQFTAQDAVEEMQREMRR